MARAIPCRWWYRRSIPNYINEICKLFPNMHQQTCILVPKFPVFFPVSVLPNGGNIAAQQHWNYIAVKLVLGNESPVFPEEKVVFFHVSRVAQHVGRMQNCWWLLLIHVNVIYFLFLGTSLKQGSWHLWGLLSELDGVENDSQLWHSPIRPFFLPSRLPASSCQVPDLTVFERQSLNSGIG